MKVRIAMPNGRAIVVSDDEPLCVERDGQRSNVYPIRLESGDKIVVDSVCSVGPPPEVEET
jgi:hypothetical protein